MAKFNTMKQTIKTMIIIFCFFFPLLAQGGENYKAFNRLIKQTDIESFYTVNELRMLFEDPLLQESEEVLERFKRKPEKNKTYKEYKNIFLQEKRIKKGLDFYGEHKNTLKKIMKDFQIDPLIIVAIIGIETNYGTRFAEHSVFVSLYTQASKIPQRRTWATKEMFELLVYCKEEGIDPFSVEGSYAGAFGFGQFVPSSFNKLSIDYNQNGKKEPYGWEDVLGSVAHYLVENGDPPNDYNFSFRSKAWHAIRTYNRSDHYANTVIEFRNELAKQLFLST